jgi:nucleotide-binding universal stress UspA family protein
VAEDQGRVVVGVSGSLGSLAALRCAVEQARCMKRGLVAVLAWIPPGGEVNYRSAPCPPLAKVWEECACGRLRTAFEEALGGYPADLRVRPVVVRGDVGPALCEVADRPDDLLVVGAGRRGHLTRLVHGHVGRYVLAHAGCPVLAVPWSSPFEAESRALRSLGRTGSANW